MTPSNLNIDFFSNYSIFFPTLLSSKGNKPNNGSIDQHEVDVGVTEVVDGKEVED
jgi:hypothetical protein